MLSKRQKKAWKIFVYSVIVTLLFGCGVLAGAVALVPASGEIVTPTEPDEPVMATIEASVTTEMTVVPLPTATEISEPTATSIPVPKCLTPGDIEHQRNILTDLQRELYEQEVVGEIICFKGTIREVYPDGDITLDDSSVTWNAVRLLGVPLEVGITLSKDQLFSGSGVVTEVSNGFLGLGMSLDIWVTSWDACEGGKR